MKYLQDGYSVNGVQNRSTEYIQDGDDDEGDAAAAAAAAAAADDDDEGKTFIQLFILDWPKKFKLFDTANLTQIHHTHVNTYTWTFFV